MDPSKAAERKDFMARINKTKNNPKNQKAIIDLLGGPCEGCSPEVAMAILDELEGKGNKLPTASTAVSVMTAKLPVRPVKDAGNPLPKARSAPSNTVQSGVPSARLASASKKEQNVTANAKAAVGNSQNKTTTTAPGAAGKAIKKT